MNPARHPIKRTTSRNCFRADWMYRRLPAGDAMLASGKGLSPAFFRLLDAVQAGQAISFAELDALFPRMDADDLELWLAELCRMQLITPDHHAAATTVTVAAAVRAGAATTGVAAPVVATVAVAATVVAKAASAATVPTVKSTPAAAIAAAAVIPAAPAIPVAALMPAAPMPATPVAAPAVAAAPTAPPVAGLSTGALPLAAANDSAPANWKHAPIDYLYSELLAICAELEEREGEMPELALARMA